MAHLRRVFRFLQHVFDKYAVAAGRVVYHDVSDCTDKPPVLHNGTAGHALNDAAGQVKKRAVGYADDKVFRHTVGVGNAFDFNFVALRFAACA